MAGQLHVYPRPEFISGFRLRGGQIQISRGGKYKWGGGQPHINIGKANFQDCYKSLWLQVIGTIMGLTCIVMGLKQHMHYNVL